MNNQWLSIQSFIQDQELLEAINTISIHIKLNLAGDTDTERIQDVEKSKDKLSNFLSALDALLKQKENVQGSQKVKQQKQ